MAVIFRPKIHNVLYLVCGLMLLSLVSFTYMNNAQQWYISNSGSLNLESSNIDPVAIDDNGVDTILIWAATKHGNNFGYGKEAFADQCKMDTCALTDDIRKFPNARAVIFYVINVTKKFNFPSDGSVKQLPHLPGYPVRVRRDQIFVFLHIESPTWRYSPNLGRLSDLFNVTMTYLEHPDTDIVVRRPVPKPKILPPDQLLEAVKKKTKMVAWVVSNCDNPSNSRDRYTSELKKYINVDIYGKCGIPCNDTWLGMDCFYSIEKQYKFYLAFENGFCEDYITEKMYRTLSLNLVPIALNGANNSKLLPPHSYIDVRDFRSPRYLAEYLNELDSNNTRYMEYFEWKKSYVAREIHKPFCELCKILSNKKHQYKSNFHPDKYWNATKYCKTREDEYAAVGLI